MEEMRAGLTEIEDQRHPSYEKYPLADILMIAVCAVLCGLDTLGDQVIYAKSKKDFLAKEFGIEEIPSKATFARVLRAERKLVPTFYEVSGRFGRSSVDNSRGNDYSILWFFDHSRWKNGYTHQKSLDFIP